MGKLEVKFKFKVGDIVYHKTDKDHICSFVILTRSVIEGVSGGKALWYACYNLIHGNRTCWEGELVKC